MDVVVSVPVKRTYRTVQAAGLFDFELGDSSEFRTSVDVPDGLADLRDWRIGMIIGPSGSGKSTLARELFRDSYFVSGMASWSDDESVIDCFPEDMSVLDIVGLLSHVGFSTSPNWVRPYRVLSTGERFRCDLARAIVAGSRSAGGLVVFDEYTSVVDRTVARFLSAALSRALRSGKWSCRFVAVTCHYDVVEWLCPDWVVDMQSGQFNRRCLQRPEIELRVYRAGRSAWRLFARYHYMTSSLPAMPEIYVGMYDDRPVAVCVMVMNGKIGMARISRLVVLPDYQGVGIGGRLMDAMAALYREQGYAVRISATHPAVWWHCLRGPWVLMRKAMTQKQQFMNYKRRKVAMFRPRGMWTFEYQPGVRNGKREENKAGS